MSFTRLVQSHADAPLQVMEALKIKRFLNVYPESSLVRIGTEQLFR